MRHPAVAIGAILLPASIAFGRPDPPDRSNPRVAPAGAARAEPWNDPGDVDTDGDGLSDFRERHKHFTNPLLADSDSDGIPDGDWSERREYTYTVRSIVHVLPPVTPDVFEDDYQDARILDRGDDHLELEVIHYPLNTVASTIAGDPGWRAAAAAMTEWTRPGLTANYDAAMQAALARGLEAAGIDSAALDDKSLVERASTWLLRHARYVDGFTTFCSRFVDGKAIVHPGMERSAVEGQAAAGLSIEEQWERELFAKGMFEHRVRGSCTSSAIYLDGCLRALGIPTRIVLVIPVIDATDERERAMVGRLRHHGVRRTIEDATSTITRGWTSHTFNEVHVGGRWRRLNYDRLGQNTLDNRFLGLMTHVATFSDWSDGDMASTWGVRQASSDEEKSMDPFGGPNPYSTVALSDRFGAHATIDNPSPAELPQEHEDSATAREHSPPRVAEPDVAAGTSRPAADEPLAAVEPAGDRGLRSVPAGMAADDNPGASATLTIDRVHWSDGADSPTGSLPGMRPIILARVGPQARSDEHKAFTQSADLRFHLEAPGHPTLDVDAAVGCVTTGTESFVIVELGGADWEAIQPGVAYTLRARNDHPTHRWLATGPLRVRR